MTDAQRVQIRNLRAAGLGYKKIAEQMGMSPNTVKTYCQRHDLGGNQAMQKQNTDGELHVCYYCGVVVEQNPGRKEKKFCSDSCRNKWWNGRLHQVKKKAFYEYECAYCKKSFIAYGNAKRKYCSHECFVADKFGGDADE